MTSNERLVQLLVGEEVLTEDDPRHAKNSGAKSFINNSGSFDGGGILGAIGGALGDVGSFFSGVGKDILHAFATAVATTAEPAIHAGEAAAAAIAKPLGWAGDVLSGGTAYLGNALLSWIENLGGAANAQATAKSSSAGGGALVIGNQATGTMLQFFTDVLNGIGAPVDATTLADLSAWQTVEGGWTNGDNFNPFNTTQPAGGSVGTNSVGVQNYPSYSAGLSATIATLNNGLYPGILSALESGAPLGVFESAVNSSPWGTVFDNGGLLQPGVTLAVNNTGKAEVVSTAGSGGGASVTINATFNGVGMETRQMIQQELGAFATELDQLIGARGH
jgi:hypothetical protein